MEGLEENKALQKADYMAESESKKKQSGNRGPCM
jgi:hypothetical protein